MKLSLIDFAQIMAPWLNSQEATDVYTVLTQQAQPITDEVARQAVIDYVETLEPWIGRGSLHPNDDAIAAMKYALERAALSQQEENEPMK